MKNIFILGSGRSGTSMLAGLFSNSHFHMGDKLYPARETNPKGFFESAEINHLNENILRHNIPAGVKSLFKNRYNKNLQRGQLWLANFEPGIKIKSNHLFDKEIKVQTSKSPFCYKDPRFVYTYPVWQPFAGEHVCLLIFRHPAKTIESMIKEINSQSYLDSYKPNISRLNSIWVNQYINALKNIGKNVLIVHYDQVFDNEYIEKLKEVTGCDELKEFSERKLDRSKGLKIPTTTDSEKMYKELCKLAKYRF